MCQETDRHGETQSIKVLINPGPEYLIKPLSRTRSTFGVFVATDRSAIQQMRVNELLLGTSRTDGGFAGAPRYYQTARQQQKTTMEPEVDPKAELTHEALSTEALRRLEQQRRLAANPPIPDEKLLAQGGHILICVVGADNLVPTLGIRHLIANAGPINFYDEGAREKKGLPPSRKYVSLSWANSNFLQPSGDCVLCDSGW